jgi:nuclear transport factor 2 (NTF2) superfamily protein
MAFLAAGRTTKPPFTEASARAKVQEAQDLCTTRNPELVAQPYT